MDEITPDIQALVRERRKIEAIRALRLQTGLGLKEAKDRIDALEQQLGIARPPLSRTARSTIYWLIFLVVGLVIYWVSTRFQTP
jgi:ribosomal L7/L12-like protein